MSSFYNISGSLTLRPCPEVSALVETLREWGDLGVEYNPETGNFEIFGGASMSSTGVKEFDAQIKQLGRYAIEASLFCFDVGSGDGGGVFAVGPTEEAAAECLSEYHKETACDQLPQMTDAHVRELLEYVYAEHLGRVANATTGVTV